MFQKFNMAAQKPEVCKPFVVICGSHQPATNNANQSVNQR